jgi:hypothetical protein
MPTDIPFAVPETPAAPRAAFAELIAALAPLAGDRDLPTLGEAAWSALHGLAGQLTGRPVQPRPVRP